jgi:hypothetical protein
MTLVCPLARGAAQTYINELFWNDKAPKLVDGYLSTIIKIISDKIEEELNAKFPKFYVNAWVQIQEHQLTGQYPVYGDIKFVSGNARGVVEVYFNLKEKPQDTWEMSKELKVSQYTDGKFSWSEWDMVRFFTAEIQNVQKAL